jgi:demethylmenaquinone methyltransferase/2-methoxy-6-polyprenyl-1,4-benzoquinol methylase
MTAEQVTVVEISPDSIAASQARLGRYTRKVRYIEANAYQWRATERFDSVVLPFWLTHVPPDRFESFWSFVRTALTPRGRVLLLDNQRTTHGTARDHVLPRIGEIIAIRRRNGGEHRVYKTFYSPESLAERLNALGWEADLHATREFFIYGTAQRVD